MTAVLFFVCALAVAYDAYRQIPSARESLRAVDHAEIASISVGENKGIPLLSDENVTLVLSDGTKALYREWFPDYALVKTVLLSRQPVSVLVDARGHYHTVLQVDSGGRTVVAYDAVAGRIRSNQRGVFLLAALMAFCLAPYCAIKARALHKQRGQAKSAW
jgi:hypothetical protein